MQPRITISLPFFERPQRTVRAIQSILDQDTDGWELLLTGDRCPNFKNIQAFLTVDIVDEYKKRGNIIYLENLSVHTGYWGTEIRNKHIQDATGHCFMFMGSDDILRPNHLSTVLPRFEKSQYQFMYFDTFVEPYNDIRDARLESGHIGHSELIIKTDFLKKMPQHRPFYGHDFALIQSMMAATGMHTKAVGAPATYIVKSVPGRVEQGID